MKKLLNQSFHVIPNSKRVYSDFSNFTTGFASYEKPKGENTQQKTLSITAKVDERLETAKKDVRKAEKLLAKARETLAKLEEKKNAIKKSSSELSALDSDILDDDFYEETQETIQYKTTVGAVKAMLAKKAEILKILPKDSHDRRGLLMYNLDKRFQSVLPELGLSSQEISQFLEGMMYSHSGRIHPQFNKKLIELDETIASMDNFEANIARAKVTKVTKMIIDWLSSYDPNQGGSHVSGGVGRSNRLLGYDIPKFGIDTRREEQGSINASDALDKYRN